MMKVLAAIDISAAATPVLATAAALARLYDAKVEALHMGADTEAARSLARAAGVELRLFAGPTVRELMMEAERDEDVVATVVGARGLPFGRRPVGSTALSLITEMQKPLVIVPPEARSDGIDRILVPLDGTRASAVALDPIIRRACAGGAEVVILHVHHGDVPRFGDQPQHETDAWAVEFLARNCPCRHGVDLKLRAGLPGENVLQVAQNMDARLIALSWSQVLTPDRAAVVREVLERSTIPVLLVPVAHA